MKMMDNNISCHLSFSCHVTTGKMIVNDAQIGCWQMLTLDLGVSCRVDSIPGHSVCIPSM